MIAVPLSLLYRIDVVKILSIVATPELNCPTILPVPPILLFLWASILCTISSYAAAIILFPSLVGIFTSVLCICVAPFLLPTVTYGTAAAATLTRLLQPLLLPLPPSPLLPPPPHRLLCFPPSSLPCSCPLFLSDC
jgi:hypothetical protein